jgi:hypothetical protein
VSSMSSRIMPSLLVSVRFGPQNVPSAILFKGLWLKKTFCKSGPTGQITKCKVLGQLLQIQHNLMQLFWLSHPEPHVVQICPGKVSETKILKISSPNYDSRPIKIKYMFLRQAEKLQQ